VRRRLARRSRDEVVARAARFCSHRAPTGHICSRGCWHVGIEQMVDVGAADARAVGARGLPPPDEVHYREQARALSGTRRRRS